MNPKVFTRIYPRLLKMNQAAIGTQIKILPITIFEMPLNRIVAALSWNSSSTMAEASGAGIPCAIKKLTTVPGASPQRIRALASNLAWERFTCQGSIVTWRGRAGVGLARITDGAMTMGGALSGAGGLGVSAGMLWAIISFAAAVPSTPQAGQATA